MVPIYDAVITPTIIERPEQVQMINEYAFLTAYGLVFSEITKFSDKLFQVKENMNEIYFRGHVITAVYFASLTIMLVAV